MVWDPADAFQERHGLLPWPCGSVWDKETKTLPIPLGLITLVGCGLIPGMSFTRWSCQYSGPQLIPELASASTLAHGRLGPHACNSCTHGCVEPHQLALVSGAKAGLHCRGCTGAVSCRQCCCCTALRTHVRPWTTPPSLLRRFGRLGLRWARPAPVPPTPCTAGDDCGVVDGRVRRAAGLLGEGRESMHRSPRPSSPCWLQQCWEAS